MTAVVGILNKHAVAIAADSAVTISGANGTKIFNKANKIFTLSKYHPVGIMIYNSASLMSTPWETIIKTYRSSLKDNSFDTLKEYQTNFISFLKSNNFYTSVHSEKTNFYEFADSVVVSIIKKAFEGLSGLSDPFTSEDLLSIASSVENVSDIIIANYEQADKFDDFNDYEYTDFNSYVQDVFVELITNRFTDQSVSLSNEQIEKLKLAVYRMFLVKENISIYSGLIFCGFGENEIYPNLIATKIYSSLNGRLRYFIDESHNASINDQDSGIIRPFAQTDVIDTILAGVSPSLNSLFVETFIESTKEYNNNLLEQIRQANPVLASQIGSIDIQPIVDEYIKKMQGVIRNDYINPLLDAVRTLSKEDLAEMAESLIYLTYLKRRMTFAEESVGGPVDVAIISKGDGFVWIKRKHYFKPELNKHFFDNYFNH